MLLFSKFQQNKHDHDWMCFETDLCTDMRVDSTHGVVQEIDVVVLVDGPGQRDARLLSARQVDSLLADFGHVARGQHLQIGVEGTRVQHSVVEVLVESGMIHFSEAQEVQKFPYFLPNVMLLRMVLFCIQGCCGT